MIPTNAETIEMLDGRVFFSTDTWVTVFVAKPGEQLRKVTGRAADVARFLAVAQARQ